MKTLYLLLALTASQYTFAQKADSLISIPDIDSLKAEVLEIMSILEIPVRKNVHLDGRLQITASDMGDVRGQFVPIMIENGHLDSSEYYYPLAWLRFHYSIVYDLQRRDTSMRYYDALSVVAHELAHYYNPHVAMRQSILDSIDRRAYANLPVEYKATAVQGFLFLRRYKPELIEPNLLTPPSVPDRIQKRFANRYAEITNPKDNPINMGTK